MPRNPHIGAEGKDLFQLIRTNKVYVAYEGLFDQEIVKGFLSITENSLAEQGVQDGVKKKLFNVMMEALQNICKHQASAADQRTSAIFVLSGDEKNYYVQTGNLIGEEKVNDLQAYLNKLNALNADELKELYKTVRMQSTISEVGGAGLGFIDMIRKTGNALRYNFDVLPDGFRFFTLVSTISIES